MDNKRRHIRFEPEENTFVFVNIDNENVHGGLCTSESQSGCSGVFRTCGSFVAGKMVYVKVGALDALSAEIKWVSELDKDTLKVGFEYLS
jgi:hypothetical protein